jgi:hypothetical protein
METLRLQSWDVFSARQQIPELLEPQSKLACWVGSVLLDDESNVSDFITKAKQNDVVGLAQYQQIGGDLAYAVLLKLVDDQWKLVVIKSPYDPCQAEQAIFVAIARLKISIEVYNREAAKEEQELLLGCRLRYRDILKEWIRLLIRF